MQEGGDARTGARSEASLGAMQGADAAQGDATKRGGIIGRYATYTSIALMLGSVLIIGLPVFLTQDNWLAVVFSIVPVTLLMAIYARLCKLMPDMDLYAMMRVTLGSVAGRVCAALMAAYALFLASLAIYYMSTFVNLTSLHNTPYLLIALVLTAPAAYIAWCGPRMLGRWATFLIGYTVFIMVVVVMISMGFLDPKKLMPVMGHGFTQVASHSLRLVGLPFGEAVIALTVLGTGTGRKRGKVRFIGAGIFAVVIVAFAAFRILAALGPHFAQTTYFVYYKAASIIRVSKFLQRIEALLGLMYLLITIFRTATCAMSAARGVASALNKPGDRDGRALAIPFVALALALSGALFSNNFQGLNFQLDHWWFGLPFQVGLPVVVWICAEVRARRGRRGRREEAGEAGM